MEQDDDVERVGVTSLAQQLLLTVLVIGTVCAAVLAVVGVSVVAIAAIALIPLPVTITVAAVVGWVVYEANKSP